MQSQLIVIVLTGETAFCLPTKTDHYTLFRDCNILRSFIWVNRLFPIDYVGYNWYVNRIIYGLKWQGYNQIM